MSIWKANSGPPFSAFEAQEERGKGQLIHACYWCLNYGHPEYGSHRPFWPAKMLKFIKQFNACPKHYKDEMGK